MHAMTVTSDVPEHVYILMGTYNGARWLPEQLASFVKQSHQEWFLWVSDDGSTDGTRSILEDFAAEHPGRVRILEGPHQGSAANFLYLLCHPELPSNIVTLSDQDDVWMPHRLARAVEQLHAAGSAPCVWSGRYLIEGTRLQPSHASSLWSRGPSLGNALIQNILAGHTLTLNPAALEIVRKAGIQPVPHHDWWIYQLLMASGGQALIDTQIVLRYRQHGSNAVGARSSPVARFARIKGLLRGRLRDWMVTNLGALEAVSAQLTPTARDFLHRWPKASRLEKLRLMFAFSIHRQSRAETILIYLAVALGRL